MTEDEPKKPRRQKGEGGVTERKDGNYQASYKPGPGLPRVYIYGKTEPEVKKRLAKALRDRDLGIRVLAANKQTVSQYLNNWLDSVRADLRPNTWESYESHLRIHIKPELGLIKLSELTSQHIQSFKAHLAKPETKLSTYAQRRVFTVLNHALQQAYEMSLILDNPAARVRAPRIEKVEQTALTKEQAMALLAAVRGDRLEAYYRVALAIGLRRGEGLALRWSDVDLDKGILVVRSTLQETRSGLQFFTPKTSSGHRRIKLPLTIQLALQQHRADQEAERKRARRWEDNDLVFATRYGTAVQPSNINRHFNRMLKLARVGHVRFHDTRHTAATLMRAQGIPDHVISRILGHSSIRVTHDLYGHRTDPEEQAGADSLDDMWADSL